MMLNYDRLSPQQSQKQRQEYRPRQLQDIGSADYAPELRSPRLPNDAKRKIAITKSMCSGVGNHNSIVSVSDQSLRQEGYIGLHTAQQRQEIMAEDHNAQWATANP
jgi:hypothetical protein